MKFIDLFSGIGGFRQGFEKAGFRCVFSCEIDRKCRDVYAQNFGEIPFEDIRKINPIDLEYFDVLVAGFPCQPFSICGKKRGFEDTRGTIFFDICKIIKAKQPQVIVLENVKHLIHHDGGNTLEIILVSLEDLGYNVNYKMLNAKDFGIAQHRERIFIIATKGKEFNFSQLKVKFPPKLRDFLDETGNFEILNKSEYTLIDYPRKQDSGLLFVGYRNKGTWKTGVRPHTEHLSRVHRQPNRIYSVDGVHPTIPSQETSGRFFIYIPEEDMVRKLTLKECYRLMGFPEDFKSHPITGESYKQIGNSVCVPVVEAIAKEILNQNLLSKELNEPHRKTEEYIQLMLFN
ncbi:MAG: DNA cytosine methyltransferase [Oscillatoriaceae cyanobacterium Prado104]|jgi:DNA (cytosine-5)-methyltransferase 1|nr:DNA cytosine methyltransferase [Oscillatoriaceae cyanobacterium Prado104]